MFNTDSNFSALKNPLPVLKSAMYPADNIFMKISTGVAEISIGKNSLTGPARNKTYIWPEYRQDAVEKIRKADPFKSEYLFRKPGLKEREELLGIMHRVEQSYDSSGRAGNLKAPVAPGSFFDALA